MAGRKRAGRREGSGREVGEEKRRIGKGRRTSFLQVSQWQRMCLSSLSLTVLGLLSSASVLWCMARCSVMEVAV